MSFPDVVPPLFVIGVILFAGFIAYRQRKRREDAFRALVQKYGLRVMSGWGSAPDPEIHGVLFWADYPRYMEGTFEGVPVVTFDYRIGFGRGKLYGSGVGIQRHLLQPETFAPGTTTRQKDGWTFVFINPYSFRMWRMYSASDIEWMWRVLLAAPAREPLVPMQPHKPVPGEVHIRPRRLRDE